MTHAELATFKRLYNSWAQALRRGRPADLRDWQRQIDAAWARRRARADGSQRRRGRPGRG
jgi:hypothetical protein